MEQSDIKVPESNISKVYFYYFDYNMANQVTEEGKKILREYLKKFQDILN